jgi:hypothetical protein
VLLLLAGANLLVLHFIGLATNRRRLQMATGACSTSVNSRQGLDDRTARSPCIKCTHEKNC